MAILPPSATSDESLPPLPPFILALLVPFWSAFWSWLRTLYDRTLLARCRDHPLVQIAATIDFSVLDQLCLAYHHTTGPGAPPTHAAAVLLRAEFIRAWFSACSDRDLEALLREHALVRWFCGLPFDAPAPDHTTLHRFHTWLVQHHPSAVFDLTLAQLDLLDPLPSDVQIIDTFACHANTADRFPSEILLQLARRIRRQLATLPAPDTAAALWPELPPPRRRLAQHEVADHIATIAADAASLLATLSATTLPTALAERIAPDLLALTHHLATDFRCMPDGTWVERPHGQKGSERLSSSSDLDASWRIHGPKPEHKANGYQGILLTDQFQRIRGVHAMTGCTADSATIIPTLDLLHQRGDPYPATLVMDRAGGYGKVRAEVAAATNGHTTMVARIPPAGHAKERFGPWDFVLSSDGRSCRCSNGITVTRKYPAKTGDGVNFRWYAKDCQGCPLWDQCRDPNANPNGHRITFISAYHATLRVAAAVNATTEGQRLLRRRCLIEPVIADVVRNAGARYARCRGLKKVQFHLSMAAAVVNLRRWLARCRRSLPLGRSGGR